MGLSTCINLNYVSIMLSLCLSHKLCGIFKTIIMFQIKTKGEKAKYEDEAIHICKV
ncbi:hypothetical protein Hanom_Chr09g00864251 [Helianthus anomalus]